MSPLFAEPVWLLAALPVLLLLGALFLLAERHSWRRLQRFAASGLVQRLTQSHSRRRLWLKNFLAGLVVLLALLSLARPQWGADWEKAETRGIDLMIALDTSRSMLAEDISPNRLERSKLAILDLLESVRGDRVGLIAFAGRAFLQCPLTLDYQAFRQTLAALDTGTIPVGGTDLAAAIDEAEAYFEKTDNERVLILMTDGEDLEADGLERARQAAENGTRVLTVGVGSPDGELIPITAADGQRDFLRDAQGKPVSTRLDEATLRRIAQATGGVYAPLGPTGDGLEQVYAFSLEQMPEEERRESLQRVPIERFQWPLLLALVLLVVESLMSTRRRAATVALVLMAFLAPGIAPASPAREAALAHQEERYEEAATLYREALQGDPDNARFHFNLGVAEYRAGRYEAALEAFQEALPEGGTDLQSKAFFNAGNSRAALGFQELEEQPALTRDLWQAGLADFQNALELDPDHDGSRRNLEHLRKVLADHTYTVTTVAEPSEGGMVSEGGSAFHRIPFRLKATAAEGWQFLNWTGEGIEEPESAETVLLPEADGTATAHFVKTWNLEVRSADPERGTAGTSGTYRADQPVPVKAEARDYFAFSRWRSETADIAEPESAETTVNLTRDAEVTAHFVPAFKLTVLPEPEIAGQAGPSGFFEEYSMVPIQAEPRPGFEWDQWIGDGIEDPQSPETRISLIEDRVAIAQMERVWNLVIVPVPEEGGTVEGAGDHPVGSMVDIKATPAEGYTFAGWEGPGLAQPDQPETQVTVESTEHTLFARFQQDDQQDQDNPDQQDSQQQEQQSTGDDQQEDQQNPDSPDQQDPSEPKDKENPQEGDSDPQEGQSPEEGESGEPGQEPPQPAQPGMMTPEEARQLLNALSREENFLPAGERSREEGQEALPSSGKDW